MLERIYADDGPILDRADYHADFAREFTGLTGILWKLERVQTFREPGDASWEAFVAGDWETALARNEEERAGARAEAAALRKQGVQIRRLRIVEHPVVPYVHWEMQYFRILAEEGFPLRVLPATQVADLEHRRPLPDMVILGSQVLYHVLQHRDGTPRGARRIGDPEIIAMARDEISRLYARAEPLLQYYHREIAPLPAPVPGN